MCPSVKSLTSIWHRKQWIRIDPAKPKAMAINSISIHQNKLSIYDPDLSVHLTARPCHIKLTTMFYSIQPLELSLPFRWWVLCVAWKPQTLEFSETTSHSRIRRFSAEVIKKRQSFALVHNRAQMVVLMEHTRTHAHTHTHTHVQWLNVTSGWCDVRYQELNAITPTQAGEGPGRLEPTWRY